MTKEHLGTLPNPIPTIVVPKIGTLQWCADTYGVDKARSRRWQALRFLEEAIELADAEGLKMHDVFNVARFVFDKPPGNTREEIGDVAICLKVLAENADTTVEYALTDCVMRIIAMSPDRLPDSEAKKVAAGLI